jgi:single-strand DNA-binding protein
MSKDLNRYVATGRLTRDPELRKMGNTERDVCDMRIAVNNGKDREPTYLDVATFDAEARACGQYLSKGRQVGLDGRLIYREWEADDGSKRSKHSLIGQVTFMGKRPEGEPEEAEGVGGDDPDIPF